jgi:hypothetical protein
VRDALHVCRIEAGAVGDYGERVAREQAVSEYVDHRKAALGHASALAAWRRRAQSAAAPEQIGGKAASARIGTERGARRNDTRMEQRTAIENQSVRNAFD